MNICVKERYSARELVDSGYYEKYMLSQISLTLTIESTKRATENVFLDTTIIS